MGKNAMLQGRERWRVGCFWAKEADREDSQFRVVLYFLLLIFVTDCLIWYESSSLGRYDWKYLVSYSLLTYPLWMMIAVKGVAREQVELMEQAKWHAVDLLPGGVTAIFLGHYVGKMMKFKLCWLWLAMLIGIALYQSASWLAILLTVLNIVLGALNLILIPIAARYYSPRGYRDAINSLFRSAATLFSGAVFPIGLLTGNSLLSLVINPFSATISSPVFLILGDPNLEPGSMVVKQAVIFASSLGWFLLLLLIAMRAERTRREAIYS